MAYAYVAPTLSSALGKFKEIVKEHAESPCAEGKKLLVFCEDRLSLAAERAVCEACGATFAVSVYTLSRFLTAEAGRCENVLTSQGSAMAIRRLIEANRTNLQLFKLLSSADAAQEVYDTIALLYSSEVTPDDIAAARTENAFLNRKLHDLELLYREYSQYLKDTGSVDRNAYLRRLPDIIRSSERVAGADVVFLGFQSFTSAVAACVQASMETADEVYGLFIGGAEKKYVNEGYATFEGLNKKLFKKPCVRETLGTVLVPLAEHFRKHVFEPECLRERSGIPAENGVNLICAADEEEECEFIAARILKCVQGGIRYRDISVMLPDVNYYQPLLERVFGEYKIPYYVDRRYPLISHPVCAYVLDYLRCAFDGCPQESVSAVVSSPLFPCRENRGAFINYLLGSASYRGAVKRQINEKVCTDRGFCFEDIEKIRQAFTSGLRLLPSTKADGKAFSYGVKELLEFSGAEGRLEELSSQAAECGYPSVAEMSARAYAEIIKVLDEAEKLTRGDKLTPREFCAILKSGLAAAEISLIPPKQDAVFVGDLTKCVNTGSRALFAGGLTDAVPVCSQDTSILTDAELTSLEKLNVAVSPKISQVNKRVKEITALNLCAFSEELILTYPLRRKGEECGISEVIGYASHLFLKGGRELTPVSVRDISGSDEYFGYFNACPAAALRNLSFYLNGNESISERQAAAIYGSLLNAADGEKSAGLKQLLNAAVGGKKEKDNVDCKGLYGATVSPTALETYFSCPYKAFMERGLRLEERREGTFRPLESGNFIHAVLEGVAKKLNDLESEKECESAAREIANALISKSEYCASPDDAAAVYGASALVEESVRVSLGMYGQLKNSRFKVSETELSCAVGIGDGIAVGGRIDRVDSCGDMVRIIDYKTGYIDDNPSSYYMGLKLQLPLYLKAVSENKRAVGAYYFPANLEYSAEGDACFTLKGFMDGSEEVVSSSDLTVENSGYSEYVGAYLNGRKLDRAMPRQDFEDFLQYSVEIAAGGAREILGGVIKPSPVNGACERCKFAGCCGYDVETQGEREYKRANCAKIAGIVRSKREGGEK